jgi:glycosyltransferase involved in cell wall biosynthesis
MRWFYVPNERKEGDQVGPRMAFESLFEAGIFSAYEAYSYLVRQQKLGSNLEARREFIEAARAFSPDIIFIQHITREYPIDHDFVSALKALPSKPKIVAHEGDPYNWARKRLHKEQRLLFPAADMTILVGLGSLRRLIASTGAQNIRLFTHSYDSRRFGTEWTPSVHRKYDAVMIANLSYYKRIPGLYLPGGRKRRAIAECIYKVLGDRAAVFGQGDVLEGRPYAKGPVDFNRQGEVIRDAWMSFNWHHFDEIAMYSSDRLQISLACGVPHITNWQDGYENIFEGIPGLFIAKSPEDAADIALYLMSKTVDQRNELGARAAEYARENFEATRVYKNMVSVISEQLFLKSS